MLKGHRACIDLDKNVLRIQGREVQFLAEHELPDKARMLEVASGDGDAPHAGSSAPPAATGGTSFPGAGSTLGAAPAPAPRAAPTPVRATPPSSRYAESAVKTLMDLGVTREIAISTLDAAGGNVDVAASLLF
jgi:DNA damage-inducible protein 1